MLLSKYACMACGGWIGVTHNLRAPFPEEFNRRLVSDLADIHFAPTEVARENLLAEGIEDVAIIVTGSHRNRCLIFNTRLDKKR